MLSENEASCKLSKKMEGISKIKSKMNFRITCKNNKKVYCSKIGKLNFKNENSLLKNIGDICLLKVEASFDAISSCISERAALVEI